MAASPFRPSLLRDASFALGIVLALTLAFFVALREDRSFWLDGTSPARLRGLVASMFYPLVCLQTVWLARLAWSALIPAPTPRPSGSRAVLVAALCYVHGATLLAAVQNNLDNVFSGRPLHWHPEDSLICVER